MEKLKEYAKLIAALIAAAVNAGALALVPDEWKLVVAVVVSVLGALAVYQVKNAVVSPPEDFPPADDEDPETDPDYPPAPAE